MNIAEEIRILKKETDTAVLAHTYQAPEITDAADVAGDSFALAKACLNMPQKRVIMCGVRFMAQTVKILSPEKEVILAAAGATCPMAEMISPDAVRRYRTEHPQAVVAAYINTTAQLKAECDVCVTSSSALKIIGKIDAPEILFIPDKNLGGFVKAAFPEKNIVLWNGCCPVHDSLSAADVLECKRAQPGALLAVHPECRAEVTELADFVGSTAEIIDYAKKADRRVIIGTERGVADKLRLQPDGDKFIYLCPEKLTCRDMKLTELPQLLAALRGEGGEKCGIDENIRIKAKKSIDKMLELG